MVGRLEEEEEEAVAVVVVVMGVEVVMEEAGEEEEGVMEEIENQDLSLLLYNPPYFGPGCLFAFGGRLAGELPLLVLPGDLG